MESQQQCNAVVRLNCNRRLQLESISTQVQLHRDNSHRGLQPQKLIALLPVRFGVRISSIISTLTHWTSESQGSDAGLYVPPVAQVLVTRNSLITIDCSS